MVTCVPNEKKYIGKAVSFKTMKTGMERYGAQGRINEHFIRANGNNTRNNNDCPLFYNAIRQYGNDNFTASILEICDVEELYKREEHYIREYKSHDPEYGYNIFIGGKKPENPIHKQKYENMKALANMKRAKNGDMKRMEHSKELPANINYRKSRIVNGCTIGDGYFVQIKLNGKLFNKAFTSKNITLDEKLVLAKEYLEKIKLENPLQTQN